ncbi:sensor histidine kinase [Paenibacillus piri]|uniref:sensor histidine kinase n=1 Tax=Paenibacillus piri TaxID=2547395 RepID=UPI0014054B60|nr:sensor histidine kinase [Paenibacillus piri]
MLKFRSLKSTIIGLFIPIIILFVLGTGMISFILASKQIRQIAFTGLKDTIAQTKSLLNDKLTAFVVELIAVENSSEWTAVMNRAGDPNAVMEPADYIFMNKSFDSYFDHYSMIDSILFYFNDGKASWFKRNSFGSPVQVSLDKYSRQLDDHRLSVIKWLNLHDDSELSAPQVVSAYVMFGKDREHTNGIFMFNLKSRFFTDILSNAKVSKNGYLCLISDDGFMSVKRVERKYEIDETELQKKLQEAAQTSGQISMKNAHGSNMLVIYDTLDINKWKMVAVLPEDELLDEVNAIKYVTIAVMFGIILVAVVLSNLIAHIITKPLTKLTRKVGLVEDGNLDIELKVANSNEIGVLSSSIQDLVYRIKDLLKEVKEEQELKRLSELAVLQSQIRPHFLYNTLFSIKQLCEMGNNREAGEMVTALSSFFRISISKGNERIPVSQEIEHIQNYLYIQQMRYGEDFSYEIEMDPDIMSCPIVKLTLQPLVENAIYHGMKQKRSKGFIRIWGYSSKQEVLIHVEDNGIGMPEEKLAAINESLRNGASNEGNLGFGIRNVHERLRLNYGPCYGLAYVHRSGGGIIVTVNIPLQSAEIE